MAIGVTGAPGGDLPRPERPIARARLAASEPFSEFNARRLGPVRRFFLRRPVAMDVVVVAWFAIPALLEPIFTVTGARLVAMLALTVAGGVVLMWRRRAPLAVAGAVTALAVLQVATAGTLSGFDLGISLTVYAVAAARPPRQAWLTAVTVSLVTGSAVALWEQRTEAGTTAAVWAGTAETTQPVSDLRIASITGLLFLVLVAISVGISVHNRRLHIADLVERTNQLERERDQQAQIATAAERNRIAREMHDVVAHSLTVMVALADGAGVALQRHPDRARHAMEEASKTGRTALADMRRVLGVLPDAGVPLDPQPAGTDIEALVDGFRATGLPVEVVSTGNPLPADPGLQLAVYRIVQESLTNALRYATGAGRVRVTILRAVDRVEIDVVDDGGIGLPHPPIGAGRGVIGMRERAAVYGGSVEAGPFRGGWRVHAVLRLQQT
jgi:signal transduction histidine kinase